MSSIVAITSVSVQEIPSFFGYGTRQYQSAGSGSGIIVGENDSELLIATNNHVVSGATTLTVCFAGSDVVGAEEETQAMASSSDGDADVDNAVSAKIKGTDEENDLAVVAVEKSDIPDGFRFRLAEECPEPEQFLICFYDMKKAGYRRVEIRRFGMSAAEEQCLQDQQPVEKKTGKYFYREYSELVSVRQY